MNPDAPLALLGYPAEAARALRELGLVTLALPTDPLPAVLGALQTLRFSGALLAPTTEEAAFAHVQPDAVARKFARADAVSLAGGVQATYTLEDALLQLVQGSPYPARGARLLIVGEGHLLRAALGLVRLGVTGVTIAAPTRPEAERALGQLPAGVKGYAVPLQDPALPGLAERADLVVAAGSPLPGGVLQPFHTVLDLGGAGEAARTRVGAAALDTGALGTLRLARQLEHATGQRFRHEALEGALAALQAGGNA